MSEPIEAHCVLTEDDYLAGFQAQRRQAARPVMRFARWFFVGFLALATLTTAASWAASGLDETGRSARGAMVGILGGGWFLAYMLTWGWKQLIRKQVRALPEAERTVSWTFDDHGLACRTGLSESRSAWGLMKKVVESPDGFLFFENERFFRIVPARAFPSADAARRLADLARARVANYVALGECRADPEL